MRWQYTVGAVSQCDTLSWFELARFCTTVQKKMMFESSSESRKSWKDDLVMHFEVLILRLPCRFYARKHIDKDEEEWSARTGTYFGTRDA